MGIIYDVTGAGSGHARGRQVWLRASRKGQPIANLVGLTHLADRLVAHSQPKTYHKLGHTQI
eukprot:scaffold319048_cov22-Tisochrysis_lutea.AAC.1